MTMEPCRWPYRQGGGGVHRRHWHADGDTAHHCHPSDENGGGTVEIFARIVKEKKRVF